MDNSDWLGMVDSWWFIGILFAVFDKSSTPKTELACCISHSSKHIRSKCKDFRPPTTYPTNFGKMWIGAIDFWGWCGKPNDNPYHAIPNLTTCGLIFFAIPNGCHKFMGLSFHPMACKNHIPHFYGMAIEWGHAPLCCYSDRSHVLVPKHALVS